ncbi:MAG: ADP-ribosylglycohydrolase family protein [Anaerolineales bacterium]|nr:ADP-ribosylglycohydrolase family protein [Anaerolineales bacterium]
MKQIDRYRGCILGLAAGDALGTTLEFQSPGSFTPLNDMVGGGPFNLAPGQWTDDTSMALCLAESLIECQGMNLSDQLTRYIRWFRHGHLSSTGACFDIGNTVHTALVNFEETGNPLSGSTDPYSAGNGSIMRLAPVPMFFAQRNEVAIQNSGLSSKTTHGTRAAVDACRYFGGLITGALNGVSKDELLSEHYYTASGSLVEEIEQIAQGSFKVKVPPEIKGAGYVVRSLEAALWAFFHSASFESGCLMAVNLGDDADTTGAVYGQLAGAYYGEIGIPASWRSKLALIDLIRAYADQIYSLSTNLT